MWYSTATIYLPGHGTNVPYLSNNTTNNKKTTMMTPKEKAKELIDKFTLVGLQQRNEGIQCALIAIDEIREAINWHEFEVPNTELNYWNRVELEIKRL